MDMAPTDPGLAWVATPSLIGAAPCGFTGGEDRLAIPVGRYLAESAELTRRHPLPLLAGGLVGLSLLAATAGLLVGPVTAGVHRMYLRAARGEEPEVGDLFQGLGWHTLAGGLACGALLLLAALVTAPLAGLGAILLAPLGVYVFDYAGERGMAWADALAASRELAMRDYRGHLLLVLAAALVGAAGLAFCCVGVVFSYPVACGALALAWKDLGKESGP